MMTQRAMALWRTVFPERYRIHRGSTLPPRDSRMGGPEYEDDEFFLNSAIAEATRVLTRLQGTPGDHLIDLGCGEGRLPIGLIRESFAGSYLGLDVKREAIAWCTRYIHAQHPSYRFQHIDVVNARYNPAGRALSPGYRLPIADASANVVYMWGVLTNMEPDHFPLYANEIGRILCPGGRAFVTAHVEDDVPRVSINPANYTAYACQGPLHCVRYERSYFADVFRQAGLQMTEVLYQAAGNCQSDLYFLKPLP